jgi:hypothetical protein
MERGCALFSFAAADVFRILKTKKMDRVITAPRRTMNAIHNKGPSTKESKSMGSLLQKNASFGVSFRLEKGRHRFSSDSSSPS